MTTTKTFDYYYYNVVCAWTKNTVQVLCSAEKYR